MHVEASGVLVTIATADGQQMRPVRYAGWQKDHQLGISGADHRHLERLAPDLRLRAEASPLDRERLIDAVYGGTQDDQLLRCRPVALPVLGVREFGPQDHHQESRQYSSRKTHKASRHDG
jgi:hypothetical protein